jgi:hypothetical protein
MQIFMNIINIFLESVFIKETIQETFSFIDSSWPALPAD